jgi:molecular chaperone DnaK (HSP70)
MWRRHYGRIIAATVNEAKARLMSAWKVSLNRIDKVLVAGGSARLPFMKEEIQLVLPTLVDKNDIFIGPDIGEAVAYGIAYECLERTKCKSTLSVGKIAPCILNDLYRGFRKMRKEPVKVPRVKFRDTFLKDERFLSTPFETGESVIAYEIDLVYWSLQHIYIRSLFGFTHLLMEMVVPRDCCSIPASSSKAFR